MRSQIESGAELLSRLNDKPSLHSLEDTLFPYGLRNTDTVEISGERSTGKTLLLSQILARFVLPDYCQTTRIHGCNASAILINTDHHFQISKLVELMNDIIDTDVTISLTPNSMQVNSDKVAIIQNSLRNLHIVDCYDSEQFSLTLHTLDDVFLDNAKIVLLAIDSMTAYYWEDRENTVITIDAYVKKLLSFIRTHTTRFNVMTVYTRLCKNVDNKARKIINNVDYKVQLCKTRNSKSLICTLETKEMTKKIHYSILSNGIKWKTG